MECGDHRSGGETLMTSASERPDSAAELEALIALARREHVAGHLAQAADAYRKLIALRPGLAAAHNELGNLLVELGQPDEAAAQFEQAVACDPGLFQALNNLGNILRVRGRLDEARRRLEQAIALAPHHAEAHYNLGNILKDQGKLDEAEVYFQRAAQLKPDFFQAHNNLGLIQWEHGRRDEALASLSRALELNPDYADAHNNLGKLLAEQGKFAEAAAEYRRALALQPNHVQTHYNRANLKVFSAGDAELAELEALAADASQLPAGKRAYVHFALGKALDDIGDWPRAFEQWVLGNGVKRRETPYDEATYQRLCRQIATAFDAKLLARFADAGDPSTAPIFVLGMPRAGSTLVEQILASHPQVHAAGELQNLERVGQRVADAGGRPIPYPLWIPAVDAGILRRLGQAYMASLPSLEEGKQRIVDKAPSNFVRIGLIRMILPHARIIHTVRDPVDTCLSCFSRMFTDLPFTYDLGELGRHYRGYRQVMNHWRSILPPGAMLDVAYEDVVDNLEEQARRLIDFCGLPWDDRCLRFHETRRTIATSSNVQVRRPLYRSSIERWRRYEAFLGPLLAELEGCR